VPGPVPAGAWRLPDRQLASSRRNTTDGTSGARSPSGTTPGRRPRDTAAAVYVVPQVDSELIAH
jgi:hypothetical protein